ncbi:UDP-N-acetylglucosamine 2-epimerase (non-hydrolyzing) [uncultured Maribacter sp.]|uniref:non-hydrolyzing UDP-N-acetylglucosamine 2-epimerase n=1 Tax=uncultured Maribacter sp. TaxID=431308 RepID=UPI0030EE7BC0|tara:strand:+ start:50080 stop:51171 length:1092 start_codon:yes stop_codon:yes gene_type:complete
MNITLIAGARPNFMKIAPIIHAIDASNRDQEKIAYRLVHTGQHYDAKMSDSFFEQLRIPAPDSNLGCGGGTQSEQTAAILIAFEKELTENPTDLVLVVGDVTSTMACAIVAKKMNTAVAHIEAGIRSFDLTMPEEINRMVTDAITDYYFTTSETANQNLSNEGIDSEKVFFVGNVMIDTLLANMGRLKKPIFHDQMALDEKEYLVMTLHRPANVDEGEKFKELIEEILKNSREAHIIFPMHPRSAKTFSELGITSPYLTIVDPMGYLEFNYLVKHSKAVITDSGGITEETTVMGVPCLTLRDNTERPETVTMGTNELIGTNPKNIKPALDKLFNGQWKTGGIPQLWDGKAAERIVGLLIGLYE